MSRKRKREERRKRKENLALNHELVHAIAPIGGLSYQPDHVRKGDGYECCIYVHEYPQQVHALWLNLFKLEDVMTSISIEPQKGEDVELKLNRSLNEQLSRIHDSKDSLEHIKATRQYEELNALASQMDSTGEVIHQVAVRLYLFKPTKQALDEKVEEVLQHLRRYSVTGTVLLNEQENEFQSLFRPSHQDDFYKRRGTAMPGLTLAAGFPFSYSKLSDPRGVPLGYSDEGGAIIWDLFHKTNKRQYYNACLFGTMGSGKSTLLKKLMKNFAITNHRVRTIDPVGETTDIAQIFGGKVLSLDGTSEVLNPLDKQGSLEMALSKAETFLKYMAPALNAHEVALFSVLLKAIYQNGNDAPLFEEVLTALNEAMNDATISSHRRSQYENLQIQLERIIFNYGQLFNRPSTIQTTHEDVVVYTLRELTSLDQTVYQAQMFNILSHLWQELVTLGSEQKRLFEEGLIAIEEVRGFPVIVDEAHHILSSNNVAGMDYLVRFAREARKYFGGLIYASQSIRDAVSTTEGEVFEKMKTLFELTQYKMIMKQDPNALEHLSNIFNNQMTPHEIKQIPYFEKGDLILNITGDANYKFKVHVDEEELALFKGGR